MTPGPHDFCQGLRSGVWMLGSLKVEKVRYPVTHEGEARTDSIGIELITTRPMGSGKLSDEEQEFVLRMLNDDWKTKSRGMLIHFWRIKLLGLERRCRTDVRKAV